MINVQRPRIEPRSLFALETLRLHVSITIAYRGEERERAQFQGVPSILEHLGTAAALESLLDEFHQREGMITSFYADEFTGQPPLNVATGLYRITQEALRNLVKHAGNAHVKVSLRNAKDQFVLEIADSGRGFNMDLHSSGLGLIMGASA